LSQSTRLTDEQTVFLIARQRLHSMQRGKNVVRNSQWNDSFLWR